MCSYWGDVVVLETCVYIRDNTVNHCLEINISVESTL